MVDQVIMGQAYQSGEYVNIGRMALFKAGWPESIPGVTLDSRCCTGLDVVRHAAAMIASEQAEIIVAGGAESMSNAEFSSPEVSNGASVGPRVCREVTETSRCGVCLFMIASRGRESCPSLRKDTASYLP